MWFSSLWRPRDGLPTLAKILPHGLGVSLEVPYGGAPETRDFRDYLQCAREDSNLHGPYSPQGPQPCASTNSATGAWGGQYSFGVGPRQAAVVAAQGQIGRARMVLGMRVLCPSWVRATFPNTCSRQRENPVQTEQGADGLT